MKTILALLAIVMLAVVAYALPTWIGCGAEPADKEGGTAVDYTYIMDGQTASEEGLVTQIQCYTNGYTGEFSIKFATFSKSGSDFTDEYYTDTLEIAGNAFYTYNAPGDFTAMPIFVGEYIGFYIIDIGSLQKANSGGTGHWYYNGDAIGDDDADAFNLSPNTTHEIQFRFYVTAGETGPKINTSINCSFGSMDYDKDYLAEHVYHRFDSDDDNAWRHRRH